MAEIIESDHSEYILHVLQVLLRARTNEKLPDVVFDDCSDATLTMVLKKHRVRMRYWNAIRASGLAHPNGMHDEMINQGQRIVQLYLSVINEVMDVFDRKGLRILVIKTLENLPDLGHDIDFYTDISAREMDQIAIRELHGVPLRNSFSDTLACKRNYSVHENVTIEVHCGRLGQVGEQNLFGSELLDKRERKTISGVPVYIPTGEHALMVRVLERMYRHFDLRINDVINTVDQVENKEIDWNCLAGFAEQFGMYEGAVYFLNYLRSICAKFNYDFQVAKEFYRQDQFATDYQLPFHLKGMYLVFDPFRLPVRLYLNVLQSNVKARNLPAIMRIPIIFPLMTMRNISWELFQKEPLW